MHVQTIDKDHRHLHYKSWLEENGRKIVQAERGIPAKVLKAIQGEIAKQRGRIEAYWIIFMIKNAWLRVRLKDGVITLFAYPNTPNHFERRLNLSDVIPNEEVRKTISPEDL